MIYQYRCLACKIEYQRRESMLEKHIYVCPACGNVTRRMFFATAAIVNGTHFVGQHKNEGITSSNVLEYASRT